MLSNQCTTLLLGYNSNIPKKFNSSSTALQILQGYNLKGKTALITGANCGIGYETARTLILHDCFVIFACRNLTAANEAITNIMREKQTEEDLCEAIHVDLASIESVTTFANTIKTKFSKLDYLILNAGVLSDQRDLTNDGIESTFQVNYLSHFHLTNLLLPILEVGSRVIIIASETHRKADLCMENLNELKLGGKRSSILKYKNSKLCNILHARELGRRLQNVGVNVFSVHPGSMVSTSLSRNWWVYSVMYSILRPFTKTLQQAAATVVYCACHPDLAASTGVYVKDCYPCLESVLARDDELAVALWEFSMKILDLSEI